MASALEMFVDLVERSHEHQQRVSVATTPDQITALAAELGCSVSIQDLRAVSRDLCATWWPWSEKGHAWRRAFFGG